ncbi:DGQHR domain-containing protein [Myxococcus llanfairpwllgwyngyllgogerychwyrndrobwllllantysiliogogogochensis]|uniref:DGQHR domain-containing protein n=1 Tax=Myxococcus llanfairpwllgwyngyllgogerychwyrndrobwllllantysiliogogogochensis TaxID=2590453 RepID=A0A540WWG1_9BACT|nr:DGQHR domain-containing protein DpdB [Myxococcus llanfairpwllgwyngyllgogerychwyrndrobwllllantysiliogogogochensis]TQF12754.1 DGQHR domain-containing protein [Myxococcus llanfairpwllgwyngyllgogerychwyrndrobwllllantysiliogogogochensis]
MRKVKPRSIQRRAIRVIQTRKNPLFLFALTADELLQVAEVSRVSRDTGGRLLGYQRPEVKRHVRNITEYLNGAEVLFPNSIILALSSSVVFKQVRGPRVDDGRAEAGSLSIPLPRAGQPKPAWIVDGQQRALALSQSRRRDFMVPVNAFIADEVDLQRDQFLRVNNTKPLPRGLITELLPEVSTLLPPNLAARRAPAALCDLLNRDPESPFRNLIRRSSMDTASRKSAIVTDTAVVKMIQDSLSGITGCLFPFRNIASGETDFESVRRVLLLFWTAVKETFPQAWGLPPARSRLMHGAGISAMGRLMDKVMSNIPIHTPRAPRLVRAELARMRPVCHWTSGQWEELGMAWNQLQNTPQHIRLLSNVLIRAYTTNSRTAA